MKKVIISILLTIFMILPMSIKADLKCNYPVAFSNGDLNLGNIKIENKGGKYYINDKQIKNKSENGSGDINLGNLNGTDFVFKSTILYNASADFSSHKNYDVVKSLFNGSTCPSLNFYYEYNNEKLKAKPSVLEYSVLILTNDEIANTKAPLTENYNLLKVTPINLSSSDKDSGIKEIAFSITDLNITTGLPDKNSYIQKITYTKNTNMLSIQLKQSSFGDKTVYLLGIHDKSQTVDFVSAKTFYMMGNPQAVLRARFNIYEDLKDYLQNNNTLVVAFRGYDSIENKFDFDIMKRDSLDNYLDNYVADTDEQTRIKEEADRQIKDSLNRIQRMETSSIAFCASTSGVLKVFKLVGYAIIIIRILVPIALIIYGSIEMFKVVMSGKEEAMSTAISNLFKKFIAALIIFIVPTVVNFAVSLVGNAIQKNDDYFKNCNTCIFNPDKCPIKDSTSEE
ncbi:MAG: hypothetical protein J5892_02590 [Bacilli bacterium]|nr:hypothetical protein [Bacilli bacterium]